MLLALGATNPAAAPLTNAFGLLTPETTITFSEVSLAHGDVLTTQFSGLGVTFSGLTYDTLLIPGTGLSAPVASKSASPSAFTFDIFFTSDVTDAAFQMVGNTGTSTFQAFLDGVLVESFTAFSTVPSTTYYGFTGILFDQIRVSPCCPALGAGASIDNLQFTRATTIPEPPEQIAALIEEINSMALDFGTATSLNAKLGTAMEALAKGNEEAACAALQALIYDAEALSGKKLTSVQADQIIQALTTLRSDLGCS
jgi:hypothetical protein